MIHTLLLITHSEFAIYDCIESQALNAD